MCVNCPECQRLWHEFASATAIYTKIWKQRRQLTYKRGGLPDDPGKAELEADANRLIARRRFKDHESIHAAAWRAPQHLPQRTSLS
jgi:hypothetical protein